MVGKVLGALCTCDSALSAGFSGMTCTLTGSTTGGISDQTYNDGPARAFESATTGELTDLINYEWEASDVIKLTMTPGTGSDSRAIVALLIQWEY